MIHLDANVLVSMLELAQHQHPAFERIARGEPAGVCSIAWFEFINGPAHGLAPEEARLARELIRHQIAAFAEVDAELAAHLYNAAGRKRGLKLDACIAACAINADAELLTLNLEDFRPFVEHGLRLIESGRTSRP